MFLFHVSIRHNLCLKLQKDDNGDGTRHYIGESAT